MKGIIASIVGFVLLITSCSQPATPSNKLSENVPASATTQSKIGVKVWAIRGSSGGVEVKGQDAASNALRKLEVKLNSDQGCDVTNTFMDSSGKVVASLKLKLDKDGKAISNTSTGNPADAALCPECMDNDLNADSSTAQTDDLSSQLTVRDPCQRAQRRIANAAAAVSTNCHINFDSLGCAVAQASYALAFDDFVQFCGNPFGLRAAEQFWAWHRSRFSLSTMKLG